MLENLISTTEVAVIHAIHSHLVFCFVFPGTKTMPNWMMPLQIAFRKFNRTSYLDFKNLFQFWWDKHTKRGVNRIPALSLWGRQLQKLAICHRWSRSPFVTTKLRFEDWNTWLCNWHMGSSRWLPIFSQWWVSEGKTNILNELVSHKLLILMISFSFALYATAKTDQSVYIIGGINRNPPSGFRDRRRTIAEYKDGSWRHAGYTIDNRYGHRAISLGSTVMIFAGAK